MKTRPNEMLIPAQAVEVEKALLSNMIISGNTAIDAIVNDITSDMFYKPENRDLFTTIMHLYHKNTTIDMVTLMDACETESNQLESYVLELVTSDQNTYISTGATTNADYISILQQKYMRRRATIMLYELQQKVADLSLPDYEMYYVIEKAYEQMSDIINGRNNIMKFADVIKISFQKMYERIENNKNGVIPGVHTGLKPLNDMLAGWQSGELYVIAARPSMGKTALALHFAKEAAIRNKAVLFFSLEMSNYKLTDRVLLGETEVDTIKYHHGDLNHLDQDKIINVGSKIGSLPIFIDEKSNIGIEYLVSSCRIAVRKNDVKLVIIDYLQLIDMPQDRGQNRDQAIGLVTRKLKSLSKELNIPVILLSQLNRSLESRPSKVPTLADLRESGNIEQDADVVLFLYRPAYYNITFDDANQSTENVLQIITAKFRNGAKKNINIWHNNSLTKFASYDPALTRSAPGITTTIDPAQPYHRNGKPEATQDGFPF